MCNQPKKHVDTLGTLSWPNNIPTKILLSIVIARDGIECYHYSTQPSALDLHRCFAREAGPKQSSRGCDWEVNSGNYPLPVTMVIYKTSSHLVYNALGNRSNGKENQRLDLIVQQSRQNLTRLPSSSDQRALNIVSCHTLPTAVHRCDLLPVGRERGSLV